MSSDDGLSAGDHQIGSDCGHDWCLWHDSEVHDGKEVRWCRECEVIQLREPKEDILTDGGRESESKTPQWAGYAGHEQDENDNEYATPPEIWRPLADAVDGFDVDPASGAEPTPIAPVRYTKDDDGLLQDWEGDVFLNPPWSSNGDGEAKRTWLRKARNEANRDSVDTVTVVLPADTGSHVFHDHILEAPVFCLVGPGRIPFIGESRNPSFDLVIAVYGQPPDGLVDALDGVGAVIEGRSVYSSHEQKRIVTDGGRAEYADGA